MDDELKFCVPNFRFPVADLSEYDDDQIKGEVMLRAALLLMKYIFSDELAERLPGILALLRDLASKNTGLEFLETIIIYLAKGTNKLTERQLGEALQKALPDLGGDAMTTLAEKWFQDGEKEGEKRGREKGEEKGEKKALLEVIETGLKMKIRKRRLAAFSGYRQNRRQGDFQGPFSSASGPPRTWTKSANSSVDNDYGTMLFPSWKQKGADGFNHPLQFVPVMFEKLVTPGVVTPGSRNTLRVFTRYLRNCCLARRIFSDLSPPISSRE